MQAIETRQRASQKIAPSQAPASAPPGGTADEDNEAGAALSSRTEAPRVVTTSTLFSHPLFKKIGDDEDDTASAAASGSQNTQTLSGSQWAKKTSAPLGSSPTKGVAAGEDSAATFGTGVQSDTHDDGSQVVQSAAEYTRARRVALRSRIQQQGQDGPQDGTSEQEQLTLGGASVCAFACVRERTRLKFSCGGRAFLLPVTLPIPSLALPSTLFLPSTFLCSLDTCAVSTNSSDG